MKRLHCGKRLVDKERLVGQQTGQHRSASNSRAQDVATPVSAGPRHSIGQASSQGGQREETRTFQGSSMLPGLGRWPAVSAATNGLHGAATGQQSQVVLFKEEQGSPSFTDHFSERAVADLAQGQDPPGHQQREQGQGGCCACFAQRTRPVCPIAFPCSRQRRSLPGLPSQRPSQPAVVACLSWAAPAGRWERGNMVSSKLEKSCSFLVATDKAQVSGERRSTRASAPLRAWAAHRSPRPRHRSQGRRRGLPGNPRSSQGQWRRAGGCAGACNNCGGACCNRAHCLPKAAAVAETV